MGEKTFFDIIAWKQFWLFLLIGSYLSLNPKPGVIFEQSPDKVLHIIGWASLTLSLQLAHFRRPIWSDVRAVKHLKFLFIYSLWIEIAQYFLPGRFFSLLDMLANGVGMLFSCGLIWLFFPLWKKLFVSKHLIS